MSARQQLTAGIAAVVLIGIYSWIMMATAGTVASWAWIILVAAFVLLALTGRSISTARSERRGG